MLEVAEAQARVVALVDKASSGNERVALQNAAGRVLAATVTARHDLPPIDNSAMDGYAVRADDFVGESPHSLALKGKVAAGHVFSGRLQPGDAVSIMTGAPVPDGADSVVMVEDTRREADRVIFERPPKRGQHIRRRAEDMKAGAVVLSPGVTVGAAEVAVLAAQQVSSVTVARRPEIVLLTTGDELRDVDQPLYPGCIVDTNSYALATLCKEAGANVRAMPIVPDDKAALHAAIAAAEHADFIVSTGGVSVGEHDHVKTVLAERGATLDFWKVRMKPGKPVAVATLPRGAGRPLVYFGLPGNPVSAWVSFHLFVRPAIRQALGAKPFDLPTVTVRLVAPLRLKGDRKNYLRSSVVARNGSLEATVFSQQGSHMLSSLVGANALVIIEGGELTAGVELPALLVAPIQSA